jgi:hypothetical protein
MFGKKTLWLALLSAILSAAAVAALTSINTETVYAGPKDPGGNSDG